MHDFSGAFRLALELITSGDSTLVEIVLLSLRVSLSAVGIACLIGLPLGAAIAITRFRGRGATIVLLNTLMGLPPVTVGLLLYVLLSNAGPLGILSLLYTPTAMIIAQAVLVTPIIAALARQVIEDLHAEYDEQLRSLGVGKMQSMAIAEVGAVIIVGGNIERVTRVMTTAIALETSKGDLALALALGIILIMLAILVNAGVMTLKATAARAAYA